MYFVEWAHRKKIVFRCSERGTVWFSVCNNMEAQQSLGGASVTRRWNLLCMRRGLEHCSLVWKWSVLGLLLLLLPSSALPAPGARRTLNTPSLQWSRPIWNPLPDSCPHYCPKLPQCGLWAPSRMEGSWPSHWGSASALTKGKLQTSFTLSPPATVVETVHVSKCVYSFSGETSWQKRFHSLGSKSGGVHF